MTATTTRKTTPTTGPGANGRYRTKTERCSAILRENPDIAYQDFRRAYRVRYGEDPGPNDTTFYKVRLKLRTVVPDLSPPNVAERPTLKRPAEDPIDNGPDPALDDLPTFEPEPVSVPAQPKTKPSPQPSRQPGYHALHESLTMQQRQPILTLAASMGGLLPLRRAVDECIAWLCPELREGAKS